MRNHEQGGDDSTASDTGLLMTTLGGDDQPTTSSSSSYPLNVAKSAEVVTRTKKDGSSSPPHLVPTEMITSDHTARHTPALRLWPLAVLVFYSESSCYVFTFQFKISDGDSWDQLCYTFISPNHCFGCDS
jgi:hypothetical protein